MKNLILTFIVLSIIPSMLFSQDSKMKQLFSDYETVPGFSLKKATSGMDFNLGTDSDITELLGNIKEVYVLKFKDSDGTNSSLKKFKGEFNKLIDQNNYNPMLDINNEGVLKILVRKNNSDYPSDIIMIKEDDNEALYMWATQ